MGLIQKFNTGTTLKTRFIVYFTLFALVPILAMAVTMYIISNNVNASKAEEELGLYADMARDAYKTFMDSNAFLPEYLLRDPRYAQFLSGDGSLRNDLKTHATNAKEGFPSVDVIYLLNTNGMCVIDSAGDTLVGVDYSSTEFFKRCKQSGTTVLSLAYENKLTGAPTVTEITPVYGTNNSVVGYMAVENSLNALTDEMINTVQLRESGYIIVAEAESLNVLLHKDKQKIMSDYLTKIPELKEALNNKNTHTVKYTYNGSARIAAIVRDDNLGWVYIAAINIKEINQINDAVLLTAAIFLLILAPLSIILSILIANGILKPIIRVKEALHDVAQGDLTINLNMEGKDSIMVMSRSLDEAAHALNTSVSGVKEVASEVQSFSDTLSLTTDQMSTATSEVTSAIQDVAQGATSQATDLTDIVNMLNVFAKEMDEINANVGNVKDSSETAEDNALQGKGQVSDLTSSIASIGKSFRTFMKTISDLGLSVEKIGDITDAINAISDQTNLLALNAAIEAARAGEQGKGFAVVADEVRNLAAESKKSSEEIMELIRRVSQETQGVIKASEEVNGLLSNQEKVINKTVESFQLITDSIHTIAPLVENTKTSVGRASQAKDSVISRVEGVAAVSEEVSASAEEIAASSEQLLSSIEEVSGVSHKMNSSVGDLVDRVKQYKTE